MAERLIAIKDAPDLIAERSGGTVTPTLDTVRAWCRSHVILARKIGGRVYVDPASIDSLLEGKDTNENPD